MALIGNTADKNAERDRVVAAFPATSTLRFYNGAVPAATAAATGTLIADITLPTSPWDVATVGSAIKQGTWSTTTTLVGTPTYFRLANSAGTVIRQGVIGTDMNTFTIATNGDGVAVSSWTVTFA
jgi:hypothetical protein